MMTDSRTWMFSARAALILGISAASLGVCSGCASRGNAEVLEAQLRSQEGVIRRYERELTSLQSELDSSRKEMDLVRHEISQLGHEVVAEESSRSLGRVTGLAFQSLLTAGQDRDGLPGDERLYAVVYPHDADGELVKLSGRLEVEAVDLSHSDKKTVGRWQFSPEETRRMWHAGFLSSGYEIDLPWQEPPQGSQVLLQVRLITPDGRKFESTRQIAIVPPPALADSGGRGQTSIPDMLPAAEAQSAERLVPDLRPEDHWPQTVPQTPSSPFAPKTVSAAPVTNRQAQPFPERTTSDRWTDETIPQWR